MFLSQATTDYRPDDFRFRRFPLSFLVFLPDFFSLPVLSGRGADSASLASPSWALKQACAQAVCVGEK